MEKVYEIDFKRLAVQWLPTFYRMPIVVSVCIVIVFPLISLYKDFLKLRKINILQLTTTCQKFSMQKRLNDAFDPVERRIKIVKAVLFDPAYLYTESEDDQFHSKTKWLVGDENPIYLYTEAELYSEFDFIVKIPDSDINQIQLKAEIEFYMLQSKNYKIELL